MSFSEFKRNCWFDYLRNVQPSPQCENRFSYIPVLLLRVRCVSGRKWDMKKQSYHTVCNKSTILKRKFRSKLIPVWCQWLTMYYICHCKNTVGLVFIICMHSYKYVRKERMSKVVQGVEATEWHAKYTRSI